jgi:eukaryotic-like serine/threonine-protein kinase
VNRTCHVCGAPLPLSLREEFCPVCTLQGALVADADRQDASSFLGRIGEYELIEEIARGGVGVVYKARQLSLERIVALKLLIAGQFADPKARARFRTEAEAAAGLRHPNIVTIYEVGEHDGLPFLAMEYVDGGTLAQCIGGEPLSATVAARYAVKIARAIQFAHAQGTLHRDLKPSNILLDAFDEPRVTDFGLAKQLGTDSELTLTGQVLGSPSFMAPEQAAGDQKQICPATDVYALGAMLYQMIVGRPPFQAGSASEVLKQVERDEPLRPRRLNPSVPQDLETITLKCLEKTPAGRYGSAEELAADLQRFLDHKPVAARPLGPLGRAWRWSRRNPALALSLVLLFTLAVGSTVAAWRIRVAERIAQENLRVGRLRSYAGDLALADRASEEGDTARVRELLLRHVPKPGEPDLREFAWRWMWKLMDDQSLGSLTGHTHVVSQVIFFPDGVRLASGSWDGTVRIWNVPERRVEHVLTNYSKRIWGLALSSDGLRLAASGEGGTRVWDTRSWQETLSLSGNLHYASVLFCNKNRFLAIANRTSVVIYGAHTGRRYGPLSNSTPAIGVSADGQLLLTRKGDHLRVWDSATRKMLQEIPTPGFSSFGLRDIEFSPDGDLIALGSSGGDVALVPWKSPTNIIRLERRMRQGVRAHMGWVSDVAFSPDGKMLATVSADHELLLWSTTNYQSRRFRGHLHEVWSAAFSPDGKMIATAGKDEAIKLWNAEEQAPQSFLRLNGVLGIWSNRELLSEVAEPINKKSRRFVITDWKTRNVTREIVLPGRTNASCLFVQSERGVAAMGFTNGMLELWDIRADPPALLNSWKASTHALRSGLFSIDNDAVAVRDASGASSIWELSGMLRTELGADPVLELNRRFAITLPAPEIPRVQDARTGAVLADLTGHKENVPRVAFLPDGRRLATVSFDGSLRLWELPTGRELTAFRFQRQGIYSVTISPDGQTLAACGQDGITRFWDVRTQQETARATGVQTVSKLWFSPDGNTLILGMSGEVRILDAPTLAEIEQSETFRNAKAGFR